MTVRWVETGVDAFLVVHAGLHERMVFRGERSFANSFSRWLIWLAAAFGALNMVSLIMNAV